MAAPTIDTLRELYKGIRDERRMYSNTATRVGNAFLSLLDYLCDSPFIRKDQADSTSFLLSFLAGAVVGEGDKIKLNADGSISCGRIEVDGSAIFKELVFNKQNTYDGDFNFTDKGIVDTVVHTDINTYLIYLRKEYEDQITTFKKDDVLRCIINNLDTDGTYYTSWSRVNAVDTTENTITVITYSAAEVPGGVNYPPVEGARLARWGNATDTARQQSFYLSSTEGRFMFLQGVTKPILDDTNYSAFIGVPPELDCLKGLPLNSSQPYIYARGLIVQDIIRIDYKGNPHYQVRDCGIWSKDNVYIHGYDETAKGYYQDSAWHGGCYWYCSAGKATKGLAPRINNTEWVCVIGGGNIIINIISSEGNFFNAAKQWTTNMVAHVYNAEMELTEAEIGVSNIYWERIGDGGDGDKAWNALHKAGVNGLTLPVDSTTDIPSDFLTTRKVGFKIYVTLPDGNSYNQVYNIIS